MSASWDDERLARVVGGGGMDGLAMYGLYWRLLEIVASQIEGKTPSCSVQYSVTRWSLLLSLRGSLVFSAMSRLAVTGVVIVTRTDSDVRVTIPNLLKYRDEYSRKSGQSPNDIPPRTEAEGDGDIEGDKKEPLPPNPPEKNKSVPLPSLETLQQAGLKLEDYESYMAVRKAKKQAFVDERARDKWIAKWQKYYESGFDTAAMFDLMISSGWIGAVEEKWIKRKKEWKVPTVEEAEASWEKDFETAGIKK